MWLGPVITSYSIHYTKLYDESRLCAAAEQGEREFAPTARVRNRIRSDLEDMGMAAPFSVAVAQRLEPTVAKLSPHEYGIVMSTPSASGLLA